MKSNTSKLTLHMVSSLDGYIAKDNGDVEWMKSTDYYEKGKVLTEEFITEYLANIDCYVLGSRTYDHALEIGWPYGKKRVYVLTHQNRKDTRKNVSLHQGDITEFVNQKLKPQFKNIWLTGGAQTAKSFLLSNLVDEIVISIIPVILGKGKPFFDTIGKEIKLHLNDVIAFRNGMVEMTYKVLNTDSIQDEK